MNVSHEWLRAFVPHDLTPAELGGLLSAHVATLDALEPLRADLAPFVVGRVVESERIPETRLSFNRVDAGGGELLDVVCGAPNVRAGAAYPFAPVGTKMPGGALTIERRKIRGYTSDGVLCSPRELGLGDDHDGILELDTDAPAGTPLLTVLSAGDTRLELDVLPNRPDLLSQRGVAREVAALTGLTVTSPPELLHLPAAPEPVTGARAASAGGVTIEIDDAEGCPRYCAAVIRGVAVAPSPPWLVERLEAVGARAINSVVDATNYCLHGLGQPMHAFDLARLGNRVVVRRARAGERLTTLDGADRALDAETLVIADAARPVAIAGVMGGRDTEVGAGTSDVLLEVAYFDPGRARVSRQRAGVSTDASYRFERGVDREATLELLRVGAGLIASLGGGRVEAVVDVGAAPPPAPPVTLRASRLTRVLGASVPDPEVERLLGAIGFDLSTAPGRGEAAWAVRVPPWRHDVTRDVDLAEDVARLVGFDTLPNELRPFRPGRVPDHPLYHATARVRETLVAAGFYEARPLPFVRGDDATHTRVANPLAEDEPHLRRSLLETLARRAEYNAARGERNVRLFEVGAVFAPGGTALPDERLHVGVLLTGARRPAHFTDPSPPSYDIWDAKGLAERVAAVAFPGRPVALDPADNNALWRVGVDGEDVGAVRRVALDGPAGAAPAFGIEIELGRLDSAPVAPPGRNVHGPSAVAAEGSNSAVASHVRYRPIPVTPATSFDVALVVPDDVAADRVRAVIVASGGGTLERVELFDEYRGAEIPADSRSLRWQITLRDPARTLSSKEVEGRRQRMLKALQEELGVRPRAT